MTNRIAIWLFFIIAGLALLDALVLHSGALLFLGRKFVEFLHYIAFWR